MLTLVPPSLSPSAALLANLPIARETRPPFVSVRKWSCSQCQDLLLCCRASHYCFRKQRILLSTSRPQPARGLPLTIETSLNTAPLPGPTAPVLRRHDQKQKREGRVVRPFPVRWPHQALCRRLGHRTPRFLGNRHVLYHAVSYLRERRGCSRCITLRMLNRTSYHAPPLETTPSSANRPNGTPTKRIRNLPHRQGPLGSV